jgi:hypothetical protein
MDLHGQGRDKKAGEGMTFFYVAPEFEAQSWKKLSFMKNARMRKTTKAAGPRGAARVEEKEITK